MKKTILTIILMLVILPIKAKNTNAELFVTTKAGNIRSGPGLNYKIVGKTKAGEMFEMPSRCQDYGLKWIPVAFKTAYAKDDTEKEGWHIKSTVYDLTIGSESRFYYNEGGSWKAENGFFIEILPKTKKMGTPAMVFQGVKYKANVEKCIYTKYVHGSLGKLIKLHHGMAAIRRRVDAIKSKPNWNQNIKNLIIEGNINIDMNSEQVLASWGRPEDINKTVGRWGTREQWIYQWGSKRFYLYFDNGILTSWQE